MSAGLADDDRLAIEQQVCFTLAVASRDVIALYRPFLEPLGLTHPQYLFMVALWGQTGPICVKDLSTLLKLEPPSLSPLLKRLEAAGLIDRRRDPTDERSLLITLTGACTSQRPRRLVRQLWRRQPDARSGPRPVPPPRRPPCSLERPPGRSGVEAKTSSAAVGLLMRVPRIFIQPGASPPRSWS